VDKLEEFNPDGRTPVSQLSVCDKIVKSVVCTRIKALGIKTEKISVRAYVTDKQLVLLDDLHEFVWGGNQQQNLSFTEGLILSRAIWS